MCIRAHTAEGAHNRRHADLQGLKVNVMISKVSLEILTIYIEMFKGCRTVDVLKVIVPLSVNVTISKV